MTNEQPVSPGILLELRGLSKYYTGPSVVIGLNNVNLAFRAGEFVAVTGESGSGKSTLAHIISGTVPYESGEMLLRGHPTSHYDSGDWERYRRDNISFISQNYGILTGSTVLSNVVSALRLTGMEVQEAEARAEELLRLVELWDLRSRRSGKLSSGQKQRLAIARALAKPAPILVADEPTGNLDPENSAKVMQLLAKAAKERLVILITHDFPEAEGLATRRIQLQDGKITADTPLSAPSPVTPREPQVRKPGRNLGAYIAGLQLAGRPVWTGLVGLFFALTAFAVFAFLGTFLMNLDDTSTRIYDSSAFQNGEKTRIVVQRSDGGPMTPEDLDAIVSVDHAESLEPSGYVTDISYAWQQDVDYRVHYSLKRVNGEERQVRESVELLDTMAFLRTVPMFPDDREFLAAGREPETMYEVVLCGSADRIGERIPVFLRDMKSWNVISYIAFEAEVVGVTDYGEGLFFSRELGRVFTNFIMAGGKFNETYLVAPLYESQGLLPGEGQCLLSEEVYNWHQSRANRAGKETAITLWLRNCNKAIRITGENYDEVANNPDYFEEVEVIGPHDSTYTYLALVSPETFDKVAWAGNSSQISLYIENYAYTGDVLEQLESLGYTALSPFRQCSTEKDPALAAQRVRTLTVCLGALAAVAALMVLVLRELFGIQTESYRVLADQGLTWVTARNSLLWQQLLFTLAGQLLGFGTIGICAGMGIDRIQSVLHYLTPGGWAFLSAVHLMLGLLGLLWVSISIRKKIYPTSGTAGDLDLEEAEV